MAAPGQAFRRNSRGRQPLAFTRESPRRREAGKRLVVLLGVQLAQLLTVLMAAACVLLLCLLAVVAIARPQRRPVLQPVLVRQLVRRATGRPLPAYPTPLPSRDPPDFPFLRTPETPHRDYDSR
jgi:hypothetical protein